MNNIPRNFVVANEMVVVSGHIVPRPEHFYEVEQYKGITIYQNLRTSHVCYGKDRRVILTIEKAKARIDRLLAH